MDVKTEKGRQVKTRLKKYGIIILTSGMGGGIQLTLLFFIGLLIAIAIVGYVLVIMSIYAIGLPGWINPVKILLLGFIAGTVFLIGKWIQLSLRGRHNKSGGG
ncbi:MAG: hypothetical protein K6T66_09155 [Peptococcaceae bacterium]|nr:hypothetical protein [Peptococcaceae bacterium]